MSFSATRILRFAVLIVPVCVSMRAMTIAEYLGGTGVNGGTDYTGQSFTVTSAGGFNNIAFNFFSPPMAGGASGTPFASGTGFLFSVPYTGPASGSMAAVSPGFLGQTNAAGGFYTFDPSITLLGGTQYYFYTGLIGGGTIASGGNYGGGEGYVVSGGYGYLPFAGGVQSRNFRVTGTPVPDAGTTALLLGFGIMCLAGIRKLYRRCFGDR